MEYKLAKANGLLDRLMDSEIDKEVSKEYSKSNEIALMRKEIISLYNILITLRQDLGLPPIEIPLSEEFLNHTKYVEQCKAKVKNNLNK